MLVTDVYMFVFMFDCLMTFYDCAAMTHWPLVWCRATGGSYWSFFCIALHWGRVMGAKHNLCHTAIF